MGIQLNQDTSQPYEAWSKLQPMKGFKRQLSHFWVICLVTAIIPLSDGQAQAKISKARQANMYFYDAMDKAEAGDYSGAILEFNKVIELDSGNYKAYNNRGSCKKELGDFHGAIQDYNKAIAIDPTHSMQFSARAFVKAQLGDYRGAIQDYGKAIELNPKDANSFFNRGLVRIQLKDLDGCLDLSKAGELGFVEAYDAIRQFCN